jgi:hypothetical protein
MAQGKAPTVRKNVTLAKATVRYLEDIAATGTHGYDVTAVIRSLVEQGVRHAIRDTLIKKRQISN